MVLKYGVEHILQIFMFSFIAEKVIRLLCGAKRLDHINNIFQNVHILKIPDLVKLQTAIIITAQNVENRTNPHYPSSSNC